MTASFPASVKSFDAIVDGVTEITATTVNQAYEEIVSLETIASQSLPYASFSNTETLTTTKTLADSDMPLQFLDPGGAARTVALPAEAATNHAFLIANQADADELITVTDDAAAVIGYVDRYENKLFVSNGVAWKIGGQLSLANTETLSGTKTLTDGSRTIQYLDPGGANRDVTLPAEAYTNKPITIYNTADAFELLTVKDDGGATIGIVYPLESKTFISNGTAWSFVGGLELHKVRTTAQFDKTSDTTLANVPGLSVNVKSGRTYAFKAVLFTTSGTSGGVKAAISGTATATNIYYNGVSYLITSVNRGNATSLGTAVGAVTSSSTATIIIDGTITVNAAGTLTVQFAQNASNGAASSVLINSTFIVEELS